MLLFLFQRIINMKNRTNPGQIPSPQQILESGLKWGGAVCKQPHARELWGAFISIFNTTELRILMILNFADRTEWSLVLCNYLKTFLSRMCEEDD